MRDQPRARWRRRARRARRGLQTPRVTFALLICFLIDLFTLRPGSWAVVPGTWSGSSVANRIGSLLPAFVGDEQSVDRPPPLLVGWKQSEDEVRIAGDDESGFDVISEYRPVYDETRWGVWGLTRVRRTLTWSGNGFVMQPGVTAPADFESRADEVYSVYVFERSDARWYRLLQKSLAAGTHQYSEEDILWAGIARNAMSAILVGTLLYTCGWMLKVRATQRRWRMVARGTCPDCFYELGGLEQGAPCPECGRGHPTPRPSHHVRIRGKDRLRRRMAIMLGMLIIFDFSMLPVGPAQGAGSYCRSLVPIPARLADALTPEYLILEIPADWPVSPMRVVSRDQLQEAARIIVERTLTSRGFWAPVVYQAETDFYGDLEPLGGDQTSNIAACLRRAGYEQHADELESYKNRTGILWQGCAHNAGAILCAVLMLGWLRGFVDYVRDRRGRACERLGECGFCRATPWSRTTVCPCCGKAPSIGVSDWARILVETPRADGDH